MLCRKCKSWSREVLLLSVFFFFFNDTATTEIYTLSLHDALPISGVQVLRAIRPVNQRRIFAGPGLGRFGRQPPVLATRIRAVRNPFEREDVAVHKTAHLAILRVRDRLARRGAGSRLLMHCRLDAIGRAGGSRQRGTDAGGGGKQQRLAAADLVAI